VKVESIFTWLTKTPRQGKNAACPLPVLVAGVAKGFFPLAGRFEENSYLVDPASSHMLVSKIKPCMSKYKQLCTVKLRMAH
jgi:hypothetical protein